MGRAISRGKLVRGALGTACSLGIGGLLSACGEAGESAPASPPASEPDEEPRPGGVNGNGLPMQKVAAQADGWLEMPLKPKTVRQGVNQLKLGIARRGESAVEPVVVEQVRARVRYRA